MGKSNAIRASAAIVLLRTPIEAATKRGISLLKTKATISKKGLRVICDIGLIPRVCLPEEGETLPAGTDLLAIMRVGTEQPQLFRTRLVKSKPVGEDELQLDMRFMDLSTDEAAFLDKVITAA